MRTLEIVHHTRYEYSSPVVLGEHRLMFRPRDSHDLRLLHTALAIEPAATVRWIHDPFGNSIAIATFEGQADHLDLTSTIRLEHFAVPVEWPPLETYARTLPFSYATEEAPDLARYVERHYPDPSGAVTGWTKQFLKGEGEAETFATLTRMCKGIQEGFTYVMRFEPGTQPPATTLQSGSGTCRDYALLMMEGSRALGLAARFVTGYLYDPAADIAAGAAAVTAQPHAWMEVYLPGAGWVEFDPTNGIIGTDRLIRVAVARDPDQAMPLKGSFTGQPGATASTVVEVQVRSIGAGPAETGEAADAAPPLPKVARAARPVSGIEAHPAVEG